MKQGKIWIDLSDLSVWKGHHTGIQRVVYQIASRYEASDSAVDYFVYDEKHKSFNVFPFEIIKQEIENNLIYKDKDSAPSGSVAKKAALRVYHRLPQRAKDTLTPVRKQ